MSLKKRPTFDLL